MNKHDIKTVEKIDNILKFIEDNFNEFERMQYLNNCHDGKKILLFEDWNDFIEHNKKCLVGCHCDDIDWLNILCDKIKNKKILTSDMEYCIEWKADVIYFNKLGKLVIAHPR